MQEAFPDEVEHFDFAALTNKETEKVRKGVKGTDSWAPWRPIGTLADQVKGLQRGGCSDAWASLWSFFASLKLLNSSSFRAQHRAQHQRGR